MFHPPPRQPLPHGGDCPSIGCRGDEHQPPSRWTHHQDPVSHCSTAIRGYRQTLARPLSRRWGCFQRSKPNERIHSPPVPGENLPSSPVHPRRATLQPPRPQSPLTLKPVFPDPPIICRPILSSGLPPDLRLTRATSQPPGPRRPPLRSAAYARRYRARGLL